MPRLMVVIDPEEQVHSGLGRCRELAPNADLDIHVCSFVRADVARDLAKTVKERKQQLADIVKPYTDIGYRVTQSVVTFTRLYEAIIDSAVTCKADFVIKPMRQHSIARQIVLTSTDWNLIRFCPLPLLLVNGAVEVHGKPVVAAIDVEDRDEQHAKLNHVVLQQARAVAGVVSGQVHCVNAWHVGAAVMATGSVDPTPYAISRDMRAEHVKAARHIAAGYGVTADHVMVEEGPSHLVIREAAKEIGAGIIVIGTIARSGVSGLFVGNTAESVLEGSTTDILIVKSPDFRTPVRH